MKFAPRSVAIYLLALASACSDGAPEKYKPLPLARGGIPAGWINAGTPSNGQTLEAPEGWLRIVQQLAPQAWSASPWPGVYTAILELPGTGSPPGRPGPHELRQGDNELNGVPFTSKLLDPSEFSDGDFVSLGDELFLVDRGGSLVSKELKYIAWVERGFRDEGRVHLPGVTCDGALLLPGESLRFELPFQGDLGAELVFGMAAYGGPRLREGRSPKISLTVRHDEAIVFAEGIPLELYCNPKPIRIALPDFEGGTLSFDVAGDNGLALIQNPVLSPARLAPENSAAVLDERPDLVIFLADTFRADNLADWGGDPGLAPNMNAFGDQSLVFVDAHAPASWTLPSQASLLCGVYSPQIGVTGANWGIPSNFGTLARTLSESGYRTAAVTDGLFVSERYGMDQGFEVFLESEGHTDFQTKTLARVQSVLDADDGRPLFLFVQTYRAHTPYFASKQAMAEHPELFGVDPDPGDWDFMELFNQVGALDDDQSLIENVDSLRRLYQGGVADLDRGFAGFLRQLAAAGLSDAFLVVTSDHGEAFGEHSGWTHGNSVYEEQVGIPLMIRGGNLTPQVRRGPVSLIDIATTFAELAGVQPNALWTGRSLLADPWNQASAVPVFSFESPASNDGSAPTDYAIYVGDQKIIGSILGQEPEREAAYAFELHVDPDELQNLAEGRQWPRELIERWGAELERATEMVAKPRPLVLTEAELVEFKAMGYFGD